MGDNPKPEQIPVDKDFLLKVLQKIDGPGGLQEQHNALKAQVTELQGHLMPPPGRLMFTVTFTKFPVNPNDPFHNDETRKAHMQLFQDNLLDLLKHFSVAQLQASYKIDALSPENQQPSAPVS